MHELSYKEVNDDFYAIKTLSNEGGTFLDQFDFLTIPRDEEPFEFPNFKTGTHVSGTVTGSWTLANSPYFIDGDITVNNSLTIESGVHSFFLDEYEFMINGTVTLQDGAFFSLSHSSEVIIENGGLFTLDWGSTIIGYTPTTVEATPPGHPVGGEPLIPGDRIIAKNGGIITTGNQNPGNTIKIKSLSGKLWDGIFIKNPDHGDDFYFMNCDISGIRKLSIENVSESTNIAKLNLHLTDFHDAGQIVVRDGHELTVHGNVAENEYCYLQNTPAYPIYAYESPVDLSYVHIGGIEEDDGLENGGGIYLYEASRNTSTIKNCKINYNNGDGVKPNGVAFSEFSNNYIEENTGFGMLCYDGTVFSGYSPFNDITICNNGYAEYVGWHDTFNMENSEANITITDGTYGFGSDYYLLMNLNWDSTESVDISGTNITNDSHLYPANPELPAIQAWIFSQGGITGSKELLDSASLDFANQNYSSAQQTLYQLLADYLDSPEAVSAIYYLYHIENLANEDFTGLRDYLVDLNVEEDTHLYNTIKKISAKTLMKEKDYVAAIDLLESIIINSELPDEVILAMIDQGYCYMELADEGERGLPVNCTVKTATLDEYQAKVRELESQFSFYPEEQDPNTTPVAGDILSVTNFPNPFNPTTTISFDLASESNVNITVYNVKGQKVKQLMNEQLLVGQHSIEWSGKDTNNKSVSSGIYFYKISAGKSTSMKKMLLLK